MNEKWIADKVKATKLMSFSDLPLGTRFRYPGHERIYTIIGQRRENEEDKFLSGTIAEWRPDMLSLGKWPGQNIFSHLPNDDTAGCPDMVEAID